jgi:bifunctional ADP-heptose synthase (sugar kinase/adenylyltransferase)
MGEKGLSGCKVVIGYFDPLQAWHVQRLNELRTPGSRLVVALADPASPILSFPARAEIVAALAAVNYVVPFHSEIENLVRGLSPDQVFDEREADLARTAGLVAAVVERHRGA